MELAPEGTEGNPSGEDIIIGVLNIGKAVYTLPFTERCIYKKRAQEGKKVAYCVYPGCILYGYCNVVRLR